MNRTRDTAPAVTLGALRGVTARRDAPDGTHLLIRRASIGHQLWLPDPPDEATPLAALVPLDDMVPQRVEAMAGLWRHVQRERIRPPSAPVPRAARLGNALRALDGRLAGAGYREIADLLFDPARASTVPWKTSWLRDRVIRLVRTGLAMMRDGYRRLLRWRRRP